MYSLRRKDSLELCNATGRENGGPTRNNNNIMRSTRTKNSVVRGNQHSESNNDGMRFLPPPPILDERDCQSTNCPSATESSDLDNSISLRRRRAKDIHVESMVSKAFETLVEKGKHNRNQLLGNNEAPFSSEEEAATTASLSMSASSSLLSSSMHSITQKQPRHSEETLPYLKKPHYLDKENLITSQRSTKMRNRRQSVLSNNTLNLSKTSNNTIMNNSVTSKPSTEYVQSKCKTKPEKKKNTIRLSDTGILGSLSALSLNTTNSKNRTVAPESQQEKQNNSLDLKDDSQNEDTISDSEEEDSSSSSESVINYEEQSLSYYVEEEDEDGYETTTSSYKAYVDSDEDDRDDDEEYIDDESSSSNSSSDGDENSRKRRNQIKYKPEVLWNGDILHPDGKITSAADVECSDSDIDSDSSSVNNSEEEREDSSTNSSTDYDSPSEPEADIKSFRNKKSKSKSKKRQQNQASKKEKKKNNDDHLGKTCTTEYSTDTDHEIESDEADEENEDELSSINNTTSNDIVSSPLSSYDEKPSVLSYNSPPSTSPITSKKSKKKSNNTKEVTRRKKEVSTPDDKQLKKDEKRYTIPRFKLIPSPLQSKNSDITMTSSASSTNNFESSTNKNQDFHHPSSSSTSISPLTTASTSVITTVSKHEYVKPNKWSLGTQIGSGSFGVVHVGMNTLSGNLMAVKVLKNVDVNSTTKNSTAFLKDLQSEIDLMRSLSHPNIVRYFGAQQKKSTLYIFQEWVPGGSLSSLLKKFGPFETSVIRRYLYQTLRGLEYLHSQNILHRDIKGGNILVDDRGTIKLADFGASKQMFPSSAASLGEETSFMMESMSIRGTPYFMPPEVFEQKYNKKADIWSVGGVIIQMLSGQAPWKMLGFQSPMSLFYHLKSTDGPPPLNMKIESKSLRNIVEKCFERDASKRPYAKELLKHEFFQEDEEEYEHSDSEQEKPKRKKDSTKEVVSTISKDEPSMAYNFSSSNINKVEATTNDNVVGKQKTTKNQDRKFNMSSFVSAMKDITNETTNNKNDSVGKDSTRENENDDDSNDVISDDWPSWAKQHEHEEKTTSSERQNSGVQKQYISGDMKDTKDSNTIQPNQNPFASTSSSSSGRTSYKQRHRQSLASFQNTSFTSKEKNQDKIRKIDEIITAVSDMPIFHHGKSPFKENRK